MNANITYICHKDVTLPVNFSHITDLNIDITYYPIEPNLLRCADILIFQYPAKCQQHLEVISQIRHQFRYKTIILVSDSFDSSSLSWAVSHNINEIIVLPDERDHLINILNFHSEECLSEDNFSQADIQETKTSYENLGNSSLKQKECKTRNAIHYIRNHFDGKLQENQLAELCYMSISTFTRTFKVEHGVTFCEYLQSFRFCVAKKLLRNTLLPIGQIAHMCGYMDAAYFTRQFKKTETITPKQFRELCHHKSKTPSH